MLGRLSVCVGVGVIERTNFLLLHLQNCLLVFFCVVYVRESKTPHAACACTRFYLHYLRAAINERELARELWPFMDRIGLVGLLLEDAAERSMFLIGNLYA